MSARGRFTCRNAMHCVRRWISMFGLALCIPSIAPLLGQTLETSGLAYVVSPPPATRGMMPNYLPKPPPESTATVPQVSAHGARRLRAGCRSCQPRPYHVRHCAHCRHRVENPDASHRYRHTSRRAHQRHGHFKQRRWRLPRHHLKAINGSHRHAPRRRRDTLGSMDQCCIASRVLVSYGDWTCDSSPYQPGCRYDIRNPALMNQQVAIIDLTKSQLSPTSAAVMCHFISASSRTRGDADWRLGGI
jgi:hypothetical protein